MPRKGQRHTEESIEKMRLSKQRRAQRRREGAIIKPRDLGRLALDNVCSPPMRPLVYDGMEEFKDLANALGGEDRVTPMQRAMLDDFVSLGVLLRGYLRLVCQQKVLTKHDAVSKVTSLANARRGIASLLGLERVAKEIDLEGYLSEQASPSDAPTKESEVLDVEPIET